MTKEGVEHVWSQVAAIAGYLRENVWPKKAEPPQPKIETEKQKPKQLTISEVYGDIEIR
jgi:hypothetical protein